MASSWSKRNWTRESSMGLNSGSINPSRVSVGGGGVVSNLVKMEGSVGREKLRKGEMGVGLRERKVVERER